MKKKYLIISILFILFIILFSTQTLAASTNIRIKSYSSSVAKEVKLILGEHPSEQLYAQAFDSTSNLVTLENVTWESSDESIVKVENGLLTGLKAGKATITVKYEEDMTTCEVIVYEAPKFDDFSKAKFETSLSWYTENLKISNVKLGDQNKNTYYFLITKDNKKPTYEKANGRLDTDKSEEYKFLSVNTKDNYLYTSILSNYSELNQDLYLWVVQSVKLDETYYDKDGNYYSYASDFVVEAQKIERKSIPQLNLIIQSLYIGHTDITSTNQTDNYTFMRFNFPTSTENRKFTLKIGKVTDNKILTKIQNNDYSGITDLLSYAKSNSAVYSQNLTTTSTAYFRSDTTLFDGRSKLENKAYYYIYVQFDDENGKYYPIEGVTLGQAWFSTYSNSWDLWAYTQDNFSWDNLRPSDGTTNPPVDNTVSKVPLPYTGKGMIIGFWIITGIVIVAVLYRKYDYYKNLK